jgi:glycolate oxidase FAD binding subunit
VSGDLAALASELGDIAERHAARELEGAGLELTLRPRSGAECAAALAALARQRAPALVTGGCTKLAAANAPCAARVRLDASALREADEVDESEGVARFPAGAKLAEIEARLAGSIWQLPLDPPGAAGTLGGALASAALGPRFGHPRDSVLGLHVALASGELVKCGGRVVKNVTGYDLAKLFVGSGGALGVITAAWLRLRPRPERSELLIARAPAGPERALAAARAPTARIAAIADAALAPELCAALGGARVLLMELAGDEAAVAVDRAHLSSALGASPAPVDAVERLRAWMGAGEVRFRIAVLPTQIEAARSALAALGASTLAFPARGVVYALFGAPPDASAFGAQLAAVSRAADGAGGAWKLEAAPPALRSGREVLGTRDASLRLQRALKRAYDPDAILNPGRGFGET